MCDFMERKIQRSNDRRLQSEERNEIIIIIMKGRKEMRKKYIKFYDVISFNCVEDGDLQRLTMKIRLSFMYECPLGSYATFFEWVSVCVCVYSHSLTADQHSQE